MGGYIGIHTPQISVPKTFVYGIYSPVTQDRCDIVPLRALVKMYIPLPQMKFLATPLVAL